MIINRIYDNQNLLSLKLVPFLVGLRTLRLLSLTAGAYLPVVFILGHVSALILFLSYFIFVKNYLSLCRYYLHPIYRHYYVTVLIAVVHPTLDV